MSRMIQCKKLGKEAPGLDYAPYPGDIGQRIYNEISAEAWALWLDHQTMLINEYRMNMLDAKARDTLRQEMEKFLFGQGSTKPAGYVPPEDEKN
jgi:Fe-S cluster biosynthesis and repair protein YggX